MSDPGVRVDTGTLRPKRNIGGIVANVTVEESGYDESAITAHPVEKTADINDHAFDLSPMLTVRVGWSPSGSSLGDVTPDQGDPVPLQTIYDQFLAMKTSKELMEVQTGKRLYQDMLIKSIALVTDADTENALFLTISLQHINLVETQVVDVPPNNVQKQPQKTANQVNAGTKSAKPNGGNFNKNALVLQANRGRVIPDAYTP